MSRTSQQLFNPPDHKSASSVQIQSGLQQSLASGVEHKARSGFEAAYRWQIQYSELKLGPSKGVGAYGEVFAGEHRRSKVAIKVYDFRGQLEEKQKAEVLHEADLMEGLRSEYLVGFRGMCFDPRYCLVMEYCEGGSLRARLDKNEAATLAEQLRWAMQISYGVYQLHSVKIIHRDLKGENILLDGQGNAKVGDFGLSLVKSSSASQSKKGGGNIAGTLPWMAPELFDEQPQKAESDIYSLGMVLWEIMSRRKPFATVMPVVKIAVMVSSGKREVIDAAWPLVFKTLIQACWDADPSKRPTAETVGDEFSAALRSIEAAPKPIKEIAAELEVKKLRDQLKQMELEQQRLQNEKDKMLQTPPRQMSFIPPPKPVVQAADIKELSKLLQLVAEGEQDQAEELIKKNVGLLLSPGRVTDLSDRTFESVTAFQYALWALDWHIWKMILKYIPKEAAVEQLAALESKGLGQHGKHFSFEAITQALKKYVDNAAAWNYDQRAVDQWCKGVGGAQRLLPAHVINEYCREDRSFYPCPNFAEEKLPRTRTGQYFTSGKDWFTETYSNKLCGVSFAFVRGDARWGASTWAGSGVVCCGVRAAAGAGVATDLNALQSLSKTRTQQLEALKSQLKSSPSIGFGAR